MDKVNLKLEQSLKSKVDYKYELKYRNVIKANTADVIETQQKGLIYGFLPLAITFLYSYKRMNSFPKALGLGLLSQYLFYSIYTYNTFRLYDNVARKLNSKITNDINFMMDLN